MNTISVWITSLEIWPLVVFLVPNLMFRRYGQAAGKKRLASLYHAIAVFLFTMSAQLIVRHKLSDAWLLVSAAVVAFLLFLIRKKAFPYRLTCSECKVRLTAKNIYFMDDHLCDSCRDQQTKTVGKSQE